MTMFANQGSSSPPSSGFESDSLAECCIFGSSGSIVQPTATPEDIVAYVGPRLRAALHHHTGPLMLLDIVHYYQNFHRQLFPTPPAASVLTVLSWLPGFAVEESWFGPLVSWGESSSFISGSSPLIWPEHPSPHTSRHHPDGYTDDSASAYASSSTSSSTRDLEVNSLHLPLPPSSPVLYHSPCPSRHFCNSSGASSPSVSQTTPVDFIESSSSSSSPMHAFRPIRASRDHRVHPSPRYSSRHSPPWSSPVSVTASTQLASPSSSLPESPCPSPGFTSSDDMPLMSPSLVRHIRAAVVSLFDITMTV